MIFKKQFLVFSFFGLSWSLLFSQTPPNLTANMNTSPGAYTAYNSGLSIAANFNAGRRFEETNLGRTANILGNMTLPSNYNSLSLAEKTLFIVNSERACRNGINYGSGALTVKPIYGVETNLSTVSQAHADWLMANNLFQHCGNPTLGTGTANCPTNSSPAQRIAANATLNGGSELTGENIGYSVSSGVTTFPTLNEEVIFDMLYQDASSAWGHRVNFLRAFTDNYGASGNEGFIGVAERISSVGVGYQGWAYGKVIVYKFYDPSASASNAFTFSAILPVELLSFDAKAQQTNIELSWATVEEINLEGYGIERSEDGKNFKTIDFVASKGQNTSKKTNYSFLDPSVKPQFVYFYRLRMVDYDRKFSYSPVRSAILNGQKTSLFVYPNPTNSIVYISTGNDSEEPITVTNLMGEVVLKTTIKDSKSLDLSNFSAGIYVIRTSNGDIQRVTKY